MEQFNKWLSGVDRSRIVQWTAIYLLIYAVINACGGLLLAVAGGLALGAGALTAASGVAATSTDAGIATSQVVGIGGFSIILALLWLISVPVFAVAAFGLFRRKSWARMGAVIALGFSVILSVLNLGNGITNIVWAVISAFFIYLFWQDAGIKQELSK